MIGAASIGEERVGSAMPAGGDGPVASPIKAAPVAAAMRVAIRAHGASCLRLRRSPAGTVTPPPVQ